MPDARQVVSRSMLAMLCSAVSGTSGLAQESVHPPLPAEAARERDRLKSLQEITTAPPPAAPSSFSPDPARGFLPFTPSLLFPDLPTEWQPRVTLSVSSPPRSPTQFDPDPKTSVAAPGSLAEQADRMTLAVRFTTPPAPRPPSQFNPDPGARPAPTPDAPFFRPEFTLGPAFRSEPVPPPLALPRSPLRHSEFVPVPVLEKKLFGSDPLPAELALPRQSVRAVELAPVPAKPGAKFGLDPVPEPLALPRPDTRRNLPFHPHFESDGIPRDPRIALPAHTEAKPDRWHVGFPQWRRYANSTGEDPFFHHEPRLWHPYFQSRLKGDLPLIGQDIFLNTTATSLTDFTGQRVPTPSGVSAALPGQAEFFGRGEALAVQNNLALSFELFRGETVFKPVEWAIKLVPVYNVNHLHLRETGGVSPDPRGVLGGGAGGFVNPANGFVLHPGHITDLLVGQLTPVSDFTGTRSTVRTRDYLSLQEYFVELHLRDLSDNYDFLALKAGNQLFTSDFRGFLFNDTNLGFRLFGNAWNNRVQYNVAGFAMREKDTNSGLNSFDDRDQQVIVANAYWQDFLREGYTAALSFHANLDSAGLHYDRNGNIVRPAPLGTPRAHDVNAYYFGWGGDGHIGRWNVSHQFYQAFGRDEFNGLAGRPVDINAQFAALEVSYDRDWLRYKASFVYASGDSKSEDGTASGFDTILDNPNFIGGPFSYYARQGFNLGGTAVGLKQGGSLVPNLRTSKGQGQANFVNPGVFVWGVGLEAELTPKLRSFLNLNYIRFAETDPLRTALLTDKIDRELGLDLSLGVIYRPFLTENVVVSAGWGVLLPGRGYRDIFRRSTDPVTGFNTAKPGEVDSFLYSGLIAVTLTY